MFDFCVNLCVNRLTIYANLTLGKTPFSKTPSIEFFFDSIAIFFLLSIILLIVADLEDAIFNRGIKDPSVTSAYDFYKYHVDIDALEFEYQLKIDWCVQQCKDIPLIVTSYTDLTTYNFPNYVKGNDLLESNPGNNNWLDTRGNIIMTKRIIDAITELT